MVANQLGFELAVYTCSQNYKSNQNQQYNASVDISCKQVTVGQGKTDEEDRKCSITNSDGLNIKKI